MFVSNQTNNDWVYMIKKALMYRVYSNVEIMSDIIDIVSDNLYRRFGNSIRMFKFDDMNETISVKLCLVNQEDLKNVFEKSIMDFCIRYRSTIENAIREVSGIHYQTIFSNIIDNGHIMTLSQIVTIQMFTMNSETYVTLRFF